MKLEKILAGIGFSIMLLSLSFSTYHSIDYIRNEGRGYTEQSAKYYYNIGMMGTILGGTIGAVGLHLNTKKKS